MRVFHTLLDLVDRIAVASGNPSEKESGGRINLTAFAQVWKCTPKLRTVL